MSFIRWPQYFTDGAGRVPREFMNKVRLELASAVDGGQGGTWTPTSLISIAGAGLKVLTIGNSSLFGTFTRASNFRNRGRVTRLAPVGTDVTAMGATIADIISVDGSGMTGPLTLTLDIDESYRSGLTVWVVVDPVSSHALDINSPNSSLNPIFTLGAGSPAPWARFWFDTTLQTGDPSGTWRPFAHGDV